MLEFNVSPLSWLLQRFIMVYITPSPYRSKGQIEMPIVIFMFIVSITSPPIPLIHSGCQLTRYSLAKKTYRLLHPSLYAPGDVLSIVRPSIADVDVFRVQPRSWHRDLADCIESKVILNRQSPHPTRLGGYIVPVLRALMITIVHPFFGTSSHHGGYVLVKVR